MKAPTGKLAFAYRTIAALEVERDALAQRCRELERSDILFAQKQRQVEILSEWHANALNELCDASKERDALLAEVEALRGLLKK